MASTIKLSDTINYVQPFINYAPVSVGTNNEPAISGANTILQTILAPPFKWRWNRKVVTFSTVVGQQDYSQAVADLGFLEQASLAISGSLTYPLEIHPLLTEATEQSRPTFIATETDDDAGNISFRLLPVPDQIYTVKVAYQARAPLFTSLAGLWTPLPDFMEFVYNWGFLSLMQEYMGVTGAQRTRQLFVASLLSVAEGLDQEAKNLFISSWLGQVSQIQDSQMGLQTAQRARAV